MARCLRWLSRGARENPYNSSAEHEILYKLNFPFSQLKDVWQKCITIWLFLLALLLSSLAENDEKPNSFRQLFSVWMYENFCMLLIFSDDVIFTVPMCALPQLSCCYRVRFLKRQNIASRHVSTLKFLQPKCYVCVLAIFNFSHLIESTAATAAISTASTQQNERENWGKEKNSFFSRDHIYWDSSSHEYRRFC